MVTLLFLTSLLGNIAPPRPPHAPPPRQCTADEQCELSTFQGCCGSCCPGAPHAVLKGADEARHCAVVDCALPDCAAVRCAPAPPLSDFVAACRQSRCVAVPRVEQAAECREDRECRVVQSTPPPGDACHRSACGCCPTTRAVKADDVRALQERPAEAPRPPGEKPKYGLSQGDTNAPPAPQCSPCPAPASGTAACIGGKCVLLPPQPRPMPKPLPIPRPRPPIG